MLVALSSVETTQCHGPWAVATLELNLRQLWVLLLLQTSPLPSECAVWE